MLMKYVKELLKERIVGKKMQERKRKQAELNWHGNPARELFKG